MDTPQLTPEPPLCEYTDGLRLECNKQISWYRSPLPPGAMKKLHERSDWRAAVQTLGYLAIIAATATLAWTSLNWAPWWGTVLLVIMHGGVMAFLINGVHELGHGTVFKTKRLNDIFCHVLAFLGWINHEMFQASHVRHHRYTLHPPDDMELVLPVRFMVKQFLLFGVFDWHGFKGNVLGAFRIARGNFRGQWELTLFPPDQPERRKAPMRWARILILGHLTLIVVGLVTGQWMLPLLFTIGGFYGGWVFWLCNNTQHVGLCDNVSDFRLCCRSFALNPVVRFLYWQMNYHIEHHMFAAVPCYNLGKLHELVKDDMPPMPRGIVAVWREIAGILKKQKADPKFQYAPPLPSRLSAVPGSAAASA